MRCFSPNRGWRVVEVLPSLSITPYTRNGTREMACVPIIAPGHDTGRLPHRRRIEADWTVRHVSPDPQATWQLHIRTAISTVPSVRTPVMTPAPLMVAQQPQIYVAFIPTADQKMLRLICSAHKNSYSNRNRHLGGRYRTRRRRPLWDQLTMSSTAGAHATAPVYYQPAMTTNFSEPATYQEAMESESNTTCPYATRLSGLVGARTLGSAS